MSNDSQTKQPSPAALALTTAVVCGFGLFCGYQVLVGLLTGEMTIITRNAVQSFRWSSNPGYFLAALGFYSVVTSAAIYAAINWVRRRKAG